MILLASCARPPQPDRRRGQPVIRVGLLEGVQQLRFAVGAPFSIYRQDGRFLGKASGGHIWRVRLLQADSAKVEYYLRYWMTSDHKLAFEKSHELAAMNLQPRILERPSPANRWRLRKLQRTVYHVVLAQRFADRAAAEARRRELAALAGFEIMQSVRRPARGVLEIAPEDGGKTYEVPAGSRIVADRFALFDVRVGEGFHWSDTLKQVYTGDLEFFLTPELKLTAVNVLPLEEYLKGVVPSEMNPGFPKEALKAQAVAARSQVLEKVFHGAGHEGYDVCATVHCQVYSGLMRREKRSDRAVEETTGMVLFDDEGIIGGVYSGVCGGHTENNEDVWSGNPRPALRGIFDGKGRPDLLDGLLQQPSRIRRWVTSRPPVYCNPYGKELPPAMEYVKKYFRWREALPRTEVERQVKKYTGQDIGQLQDLIVLERGVSGRIKRLRVVGTRGQVELQGELNIRKALREKALYSSCFVVEKHFGAQALPDSIIFLGAGWGHGVGMCQTGAAGMALDGARFERILKHYYQNVRLQALY